MIFLYKNYAFDFIANNSKYIDHVLIVNNPGFNKYVKVAGTS